MACGVTDHTVKQVERLYRKRSGIETTYRLIRQARGVTTTRDPAVRFAFMLVAAILENLWLVLRWAVVARPQRGGRDLPDEFTLSVFCDWIRKGVRGATGAAVGDQDERDRYPSFIPSGRGLTAVSPAGLPPDEQQVSPRNGRKWAKRAV